MENFSDSIKTGAGFSLGAILMLLALTLVVGLFSGRSQAA